MVGTSRPSRSQSSSVRSTPTRPASARRWITALVEPPIAPLQRMAFSNAFFVRMSEGFRSSFTICTMRRPVSCAITRRRESTPGIAALPDSAMPSASAMDAIVEAVPIVLQVPDERLIACSASRKSSCVILPALMSSDICQSAVPDPTRSPRNQPFSIGPPVTTMDGMSVLAAPIISDGVVLSQPTSSTAPSIGWARIASSTAMAARLRYIIAVGRKVFSDAENTGTSTGKPPASHTPAFTFSASSRRWPLQGVRSDQVLRMPITGRPSNRSCG